LVLRVRRRTDGLSSFGELECEKETWLAAAVVQERQNKPFSIYLFLRKTFSIYLCPTQILLGYESNGKHNRSWPNTIIRPFLFIYLCPTNTRCLRTHPFSSQVCISGPSTYGLCSGPGATAWKTASLRLAQFNCSMHIF
jgi:hypothetical protein